MRLFIAPRPSDYTEDGRGSGGIWRIITAMGQWLPEYGVEIVDREGLADIVAVHAGTMVGTHNPVVAHNHGYNWTGDFPWHDQYWHYNAAVIENSRRANAIIVPAEWVAHPIRRDMRKSPYVVPHGINVDEFEPQVEHEGYILWAKPRVDVVSTPRPMNELAARARDIQFISTFGQAAPNVKIFGAMPYERFKDVMSRAMIWLATTRETGDIASREAMAQGIPVLGFRWGATAELVIHKETGYLAEPGDYDDLMEGIFYCVDNRERLGVNARQYIIENCQWKDAIERYAEIYKQVLEGEQYPVEISVIIPTYNYAHYLDECLNSVKEQSFLRKRYGKIEVIVVDDASTDNTQEVLKNHTWPGLRVVRHERNQGLCGALNTGHRAARGKYITNLDADNMYTPWGLETLYNALENNPSLDVAGGGLAIHSEDGNHRLARDWPFGSIDPLMQLRHYNQLTSSSMMRRSAIQRLGGYRMRQLKNEDGEFWCRAVSAGLRFEQVTDMPVLIYRFHISNKSKAEGGEDDPAGPLSWNFYYPWANSSNIMPFASTVPAPKGSWAVRSYEQPHVAVCIPCGPGHEKYLVDALDSVAGQTYCNIECIVANDTGKPLDVVGMGHPWVKVVDGPFGSPARARNGAIAAAKAPLIIPLDADDMLYPGTVYTHYKAWLAYPDSLVYGDCDSEDRPGHPRKRYHCGPWSWDRIRSDAVYQDTILFAKQWWEAVGGYPVDQPYGMWEDWLFGVLLHVLGVGATYVQEPWGVYRKWTTLVEGLSKNMVDNKDFGSTEFKAKLKEVYEWIEGRVETMACRSCGKGRGRTAASRNVPEIVATGPDVMILCESGRQGTYSLNSRVNRGTKYRVRQGLIFTVPAGDAWIGRMKGFRIITREEITAEEPLPAIPPSPPVFEATNPPPLPAMEIPPFPAPPSDLPVMVETTETAEVDKTDGLARLSAIPRVDERTMRAHGFETLQDVRKDILENMGHRLLAIPQIGRKTVSRIKVEVGLA